MVLIYTNKSSPRLQYIAAFIFKDLIKTPYAITSHEDSYKTFDGIKINYSGKKIADDELCIPVQGLLEEQGVQEQTIEVFELNGTKAFFRSATPEAPQIKIYPFDIFSAAFYLLSRYEEYLPHKKDKYRRYAHTNSLAFRENFLHLPLINLWVKDLIQWLISNNQKIDFESPKFRFTPTYDIDIAYSYLHKGFARSTIGGIQALLGLSFNKLTHRLKVLTGNEKDPYDSYGWLDTLHQQYDLKPLYFFLVAEKNGEYDRNILPSSKPMQELIKTHSEKYNVGLHPSWQSGDDPELLQSEKVLLEKIIGKEISTSRQHYIRMNLPDTYRQLISTSLLNDHSMGYATINGFRASVAASFYWYDLEKEQQTRLRVHPFCYMDSTSVFKLKHTAAEAYSEMVQYHKITRSVDGSLITIIHNNLLGSDKKVWRDMYEKFLQVVNHV